MIPLASRALVAASRRASLWQTHMTPGKPLCPRPTLRQRRSCRPPRCIQTTQTCRRCAVIVRTTSHWRRTAFTRLRSGSHHKNIRERAPHSTVEMGNAVSDQGPSASDFDLLRSASLEDVLSLDFTECVSVHCACAASASPVVLIVFRHRPCSDSKLKNQSKECHYCGEIHRDGQLCPHRPQSSQENSEE